MTQMQEEYLKLLQQVQNNTTKEQLILTYLICKDKEALATTLVPLLKKTDNQAEIMTALTPFMQR